MIAEYYGSIKRIIQVHITKGDHYSVAECLDLPVEPSTANLVVFPRLRRMHELDAELLLYDEASSDSSRDRGCRDELDVLLLDACATSCTEQRIEVATRLPRPVSLVTRPHRPCRLRQDDDFNTMGRHCRRAWGKLCPISF